jgi:acyl-CoA thioester hydrolase
MTDASRFSLRVRVYYEDTDAGGIVYHATSLRWMERARTEWLRALGARHADLADRDGIQFVVAALEIRYLRPARLDDLLSVDLEVVEVRRATLRLAQRTRPAADDGGPDPARVSGAPPLTEATVRIALMDRRSGRPCPLPRWLLDTLETR